MSDHPLAKARAFGDRVIIKRDLPEEKTEGGILLPDAAKKTKTQTGTVVSVGPGLYLNAVGSANMPVLIPMRIKQGQRVVIGTYGGEMVSRNGKAEEEEYVIVREHEVLAVL